MIDYVQALSVAIDEGLEQRFVVGDGLQYVSITGHIADGPLAQSSTTESEDVTVRERKRSAWFTPTNFKTEYVSHLYKINFPVVLYQEHSTSCGWTVVTFLKTFNCVVF